VIEIDNFRGVTTMRLREFTTTCMGALALALAAPATVAASQEVSGYLYGTIETTSDNTYTGLLRWGREEAFWDDHFNASKQDEPATGRLPRGYKRQPRRVEVFGLEISGPWERSWSRRQLIVRFGDLAEIRPRGDDRAELVFRNGETMRIEGGSNDLGGKIRVWDATVGKIDVEWRRIRSIKFAPTPAAARPEGQRLWARVRTTAGTFTGYLQWDKEEALTVDELDGDTDDGDVSIPMGRIRAIERRSRRSSRVELVDGRVLELSGTNDVDSSNRGIVVEDARFGRVDIPWDVFERADIEVAKSSGRSYGDYPPLGPIHARVTLRGGKTREGRIAYDLDEDLSLGDAQRRPGRRRLRHPVRAREIGAAARPATLRGHARQRREAATRGADRRRREQRRHRLSRRRTTTPTSPGTTSSWSRSCSARRAPLRQRRPTTGSSCRAGRRRVGLAARASSPGCHLLCLDLRRHDRRACCPPSSCVAGRLCAERAVPQSRAVLARVQPPGAGRG
jgi:hypothetical protein